MIISKIILGTALLIAAIILVNFFDKHLKKNELSRIFFITGTSGSGKSMVTELLKKRLSEQLFDIHDFDEVGVPSGADAQWRQATTEYWVARAADNAKQGKSTVVCGVVVPTEVTHAANNIQNKICFGFLKIDDALIRQRLQGRAWSEQLILDNINWAHQLEKEVRQYGGFVIDCANKNGEQVADECCVRMNVGNGFT